MGYAGSTGVCALCDPGMEPDESAAVCVSVLLVSRDRMARVLCALAALSRTKT